MLGRGRWAILAPTLTSEQSDKGAHQAFFTEELSKATNTSTNQKTRKKKTTNLQDWGKEKEKKHLPGPLPGAPTWSPLRTHRHHTHPTKWTLLGVRIWTATRPAVERTPVAPERDGDPKTARPVCSTGYTWMFITTWVINILIVLLLVLLTDLRPSFFFFLFLRLLL